jgi:hypothetical protein
VPRLAERLERHQVAIYLVALAVGALVGTPRASSVPARWYQVLEDGQHGRSHVEQLAFGLADAVARGQS